MARLRPEQWADIRAAWIGTDKPIREMAREYGVDHKSITERAGKEAWGSRNSNQRKAETVAAKLAGATVGGAKPPNSPPTGEDEEIERDVRVMKLAGDIGEAILDRCRDLLEGQLDPGDLNKTTDAWSKAVDRYRKIRGLDVAPPPGESASRPYERMTDEELEREIRATEGK